MIMMSKEKSPLNRRYRLLIAIPVVFVVLLFNLQIVELQAQEKKVEHKFSMDKNGEKVYETVDQMPVYPDGSLALQKYIAETVKYPKDAMKKGISGRVFVTFIVSKEGDVVQARVVRGVDPSLDAEALRVMSLIPKWAPGYEKGEAVNVAYTVPINFALQNDQSVIVIEESRKEKEKYKGEDVYITVEQEPEYSGGSLALQKYIAESVKYPKDAMKKGINGRVFVTFIVSKEGDVVQARVIRGVDASLDAEALRVINTLPKWTPGYEKGKAVNVSYTVPINFGFTDDKKK
jgi:TonB family protein